MDIFFVIVISGMAVGYITELLAKVLPTNLVKIGLTLPLAVGFNWLMGITGLDLIVTAPASGFFALVTISVITRPVVVNNALRR
jgi:hypothetical protein